ncbi:MAG: S53 family peptidase [Thermoplasmata archaeon]
MAPRSPAGLEVPLALLAPWADRVGYDAAEAHSAVAMGYATGNVSVAITLEPTNLGLFATPAAGATPLTPTEVASEFGVSMATYSDLISYFEGTGLRIIHTWPDRLALTVEGSAANVGQAFGTHLGKGTFEGRNVMYPLTVPSLPSSLARQVAAVSGLSTGFTTETLPYQPVPSSAGPGQGGASQVTPEEARSAYNVDLLYNATGTSRYANGVGIVLLLWGWGYDPSDIATFFGDYYGSGLPAPTIHPYPVDGAPSPASDAPSDPSGAPLELTLDMEWSGAMAPGATLDPVYVPDGPSSDGYSPTDAALEDGLNTAVNDVPGVRIISMSFGGDDGNDTSFQASFSTSFAAASQEGVTVLAASGDNGGDAGASCSGGPDPQFPASSPQVLAVGGTDPVLDQNAFGGSSGIASESAWNLSGGGFSRVYAAPSWQNVPSIQSNGHRGIPDVAGPAADNFVYYKGQEEWGEGTSFATPFWAGIVGEMDALHTTPLGFLTEALYTIAQSDLVAGTPDGLVDITSGGNCLGSATVGWDSATGWGTPRALLLYETLTASLVHVTLVGTPTDVAPGGSVTAIATIANASSGAPLANLTVNVVLTSTSYSGPCAGPFGSMSAKTNASGRVTVALTVSSCYLGSHATLTATVASGGYFGQNSTVLMVNLLGWAGFLAALQTYPYNIVAFTVIIAVAVAAGLLIGRWRARRHARRQISSPPPVQPPPLSPPGASPPPAGPSV